MLSKSVFNKQANKNIHSENETRWQLLCHLQQCGPNLGEAEKNLQDEISEMQRKIEELTKKAGSKQDSKDAIQVKYVFDGCKAISGRILYNGRITPFSGSTKARYDDGL